MSAKQVRNLGFVLGEGGELHGDLNARQWDIEPSCREVLSYLNPFLVVVEISVNKLFMFLMIFNVSIFLVDFLVNIVN